MSLYYRKSYAYILSGLLLLLAIIPVSQNWVEKPKDGFPFSHYPMFSKKRGAYTYLTLVMVVEKRGTMKFLPSVYFLPGGMNSARKSLAIIGKKPSQAKRFCENVAQQLTNDGKPPLEVMLVRTKFNIEEYASGSKQPTVIRILARISAHE